MMLRAAALALLLVAVASGDASADQAAKIEELQQHSADLLGRLVKLESLPAKLEEAKVDVASAQTKANVLATCLDFLWVLVCGFLVMFMQAGFAILESGACRAKNAGTVLMKNGMDICVGTMMWWLVGYGFAYGEDSSNSFIGSSSFAGVGFQDA